MLFSVALVFVSQPQKWALAVGPGVHRECVLGEQLSWVDMILSHRYVRAISSSRIGGVSGMIIMSTHCVSRTFKTRWAGGPY